MSFAFDLQATPGPALRALRRATVALAAAGFAWSAWLAPWPWGTLLALSAGVPACALAWRLGARGLSWGRLTIDESGCAFWQASDHGCAASVDNATARLVVPTRPVRVARWCASGPLVWLRLHEAGERRCRNVLIARHDCCDALQWRHLQSWLRWLGRGPEPAAAPRSA